MSNVIPMFTFNGTQLRGVMIAGEPWFLGADVCRCLGLDMNNTSSHYAKLDADERSNIDRTNVGMQPGRHVTVISRPGLFKLIQRSNKPAAREFDRWVRHEVLPQIMDTGGYMTRDADVAAVGRETRRYFIRMEAAAAEMAQAHVAQGTPEAIPQDFFDARAAFAELTSSFEARFAALEARTPAPAPEPVLPERVTARAVAEYMGVLDVRLPAKAQADLCGKIGLELTGQIGASASIHATVH